MFENLEGLAHDLGFAGIGPEFMEHVREIGIGAACRDAEYKTFGTEACRREWHKFMSMGAAMFAPARS